MITKFKKNTSEEIISQPLTTKHISYKLSEALYYYSLEHKNPECYFENDDSLISSIRVKVFYRVLDEISRNVYTQLDKLNGTRVYNNKKRVVICPNDYHAISIKCPQRKVLLSHECLYITVPITTLEKLFIKKSFET